MRAVRCVEYGGPELLVIDDVPEPEAGPGEVVVDVNFAAINFPDVLLLNNEYQIKVPVPFIPGSELAGVVSAVGEGVTERKVGDRVFWSGIVGAFTEKVAGPAASFTPIPAGVSDQTAASFGVVYFTAYHSLRSVADVQKGEWVCVLGAAGGVGLASVEIAQILGGRVVAAASTDEKLEVCKERGAEAVINYETEDLKVRLRELTDGGADVVIDPVGGRYSEQALRSMRWRGRFVTVGFASGDIPRIPLNLVLLKGMSVVGFEMGSFFMKEPELTQRDRTEMMALLEEGRIQPYTSNVYPLDRAVEAFHDLAHRRATGKVLIDPRA
jgi:NADPH:quinone reductase-like Zn-dependent oxidoreductase